MSVIDKTIYDSLGVVSGIRGIANDIARLEDYQQAAMSAGVESLDYPAGKLVEAGVVAMYPDHFKMGSGMEGIGSLITTLKLTLAKVKGLKKGQGQGELVAKPTEAAVKAMDKQYSSSFWGGWSSKETEEVKPTGLLSLVKGGSVEEVKKQVDDFLEAREKELTKSVEGLLKYWNDILPVFKQLQNETDPEKLSDLVAAIIEYSETTRIPDEAPEKLPKTASGGSLPTLSEEDAKAVVTYIGVLLTRTKDIYKITDPAMDVGIKENDDDSYLDNAFDQKINDVKHAYKCYDVWLLTDNVCTYLEEVREYMFNVIKGLEDWVAKSNS